MKKFLLFAAALALSLSAQASVIVGFTGDYAPGNWTQSPGDGSVNVFNATDLSLTGGNDPLLDPFVDPPKPSQTNVGILIGQPSVMISFDWAYTTQDLDAFFDPFGVLTQLAAAAPPPLFTALAAAGGNQNGSFSVVLSAGDFFAFSQQTIDGCCGPATTRISNFRVQVVPEPSTLALIAVTLLGGFAARRRVAA